MALVAFVLLLTALGACGSSSSSPSPSGGSSDGRLVVAATVAPVADIVRQVVGDRVQRRGLIPEGVDSHTFEPSPSTVRTLAGADVLFAAGLHLEVTTVKQAEANMGKDAAIVPLGDLTLRPDEYAYDFSFPREKGDPNPHLWMDPLSARRWSELVRDTMAERDPANAEAYRANQAQFAAVIDQLDPAIRRSIESIPADHRKLVTYHDSFAYFARRYGIPVIGAVQPSDFSEPSAREVERLIDQVRAARVPAIFGSEVFPSQVLEQVAQQSGARFVDKLRDDELPGRPGDAHHTYIGMMVENVRLMTQALGGDPSPLDAVPTGKSWSP